MQTYHPNWHHIAEAIRVRDGHRCKICKAPPKGHALHVHHIDQNTANNQSLNLVALCKACHYQIHQECYDPSNEENRDHPVPWGQLRCIDFEGDYQHLLNRIGYYPSKSATRRAKVIAQPPAPEPVKVYSGNSDFGRYMAHLASGGTGRLSDYLENLPK